MPAQKTTALRLPHIVALYVGAVLGCGILILPGLTADIAGSGSIISWVLMSAISVPLALTMGFLAQKYPNEGGVSWFVRIAFNEQAGSLIGWFFLLSTIIGVPVLALTGAGYIAAAFGFSELVRIGIAGGVILLGLLLNYLGMKLSGQIQVIVVVTTIGILLGSFLGSLRAIDPANYIPVLPFGWMSVGYATSLIFWSFIGWEAVTHITVEFQDPKRDVVRATLIASAIISTLYILTAFAVVGTHSYGSGLSDVSLLRVIQLSFGSHGAVCTGFAALFVCIAPSITYIGAASRLGYSLSKTGYAPLFLSRLSGRYHTPVGGIIFLFICFSLIFLIYGTGLLPLTTLIQLPNATFILTYLGGCAAGLILLKDNRFTRIVSGVSLVLTGIIFFFVSFAMIFPVLITICWWIYLKIKMK
ncbi:MAG: amino acid permease [Methanospirillaceae archaeon]|nr:amino acid permease [Methanospirillaceae archaeon]